MTLNLLDKEDDLVKSGIKPEQARAILKAMSDGDSQALTRAEFVNEMRLLRQELNAKFDKIDARFDNMKLFVQVTVYSASAALLASIVAASQLGWLA